MARDYNPGTEAIRDAVKLGMFSVFHSLPPVEEALNDFDTWLKAERAASFQEALVAVQEAISEHVAAGQTFDSGATLAIKNPYA